MLVVVAVIVIRIDFPWKMQGDVTLLSSDETWQCREEPTIALFIELQRAGGLHPAR